MTSTPLTRIDPRIRERRIEVLRAQGRRRLHFLLFGMSVIVACGLAFLVVESPFLDVDHIRVSGTSHLTPHDVQVASGVHKHAALLFVDTGAVARRIERIPWVQHATVTRVFPGTVRISVVEYEPSAYVRVGNDVVLFAVNGRAITRIHSAPRGAIEIRGVRNAPAIGELLSPPEAASVATKLPPLLAVQVSAIDVGGDGIALDLQRGGSIRLGNANDIDAKAAATLAVLAQIGDKSFNYIDVSTPATPVLHT